MGELIKFKTAKLAKERGFTESVNVTYDEKYALADAIHWESRLNYNVSGHGVPKGCISAPTQSVLQTWLRVHHNLEVVIKPIGNYSPNMKTYTSAIMSFSFGNHAIDTKVIFRGYDNRGFIYEEVLEKGLEEALNLIKL